MSTTDTFTQMIDLTVAAGADDEREVCHGYPRECRLVNAYFMPATAVSIDGTNNFTASLKAGAGGTSLGSFNTDTGGTALVKGTAVTFTLSGGESLEFGATDCLEFAKVEAGTGAALDGALVLEWQPVRQPA